MIAKHDMWNRTLSVLGTVLVWIGLLAPVIALVWRLLQGEPVTLEGTVPIAFFVVALLGGALLLWAALRDRFYRALVIISLGVAVGSMVLGQGFAGVAGLNAGAGTPTGGRAVWRWAMFAIYLASLVALGIGGIWLTRHALEPAGAAGGRV